MRKAFSRGSLLAALIALQGCGGGSGGSTALPLGTAADVRPASCAGKAPEGGAFYRVDIPSPVDGESIVFQVFEPDTIDCAGKHALILEGHGYGGSRQTDKSAGSSPLSFGAPIADLTAAGYTVISIDQRGHGESGGTVRVMDPAYEGKDLATILDWAEQHLDFLKYRDGNLLVGGIGGSYGGGYQMLLWETDPKGRMDAMIPEITWHDLSYSLNPNNVVKSYWALVLSSTGDAQTRGRQDPYIRATLAEGLATSRFPAAAIPQFRAHSPAYFCGHYGNLKGQKSSSVDFTTGALSGNVPQTTGLFEITTTPLTAFRKVDALFMQSPRDDLFNLNEALDNVTCVSRGGGDVRLFTYEPGHGLLAPDAGTVQNGVGAQGLPTTRACGGIDANAVTIAWFNEKLLGKGNVNSVLTTGRDVCLSLTPSDAVRVPSVQRGGAVFPVSLGGQPVPVVLGQAVPVVVPLMAITNPTEVVGGVPQITVTVGRGNDALNALCQPAQEPLTGIGSCDSTVFVGLGIITASASGSIPAVPQLMEEQVTPIRGFGTFKLDMVGVAERLAAGDQLVLLVYGARDTYAAASTRDVTTTVVTLTGEVRVPLLGDLPRLGATGGSPLPALPLP